MRPPAPDAKKTAVKHLPTTGCRCGGLWHTAIVVSENKRECCNHLMPIIGIEGDSPDSISQYHSINTDNPQFPLFMSRRRSLSKARRYRQHGPKHSDCTSHYIRYDTLYWIHRFKNDQEPSKTGGSWSFLAPALPEIRSGTHVTIWLRRRGDSWGRPTCGLQNPLSLRVGENVCACRWGLTD